MKNLLDPSHSLVRAAIEPREEGPHLRLPSRVDVLRSHQRQGTSEVRRFEIADEKTVRLKKERVVVPAAARESLEHLGPDISMPAFVVLEPFGPDAKTETHTRSKGSPPSNAGVSIQNSASSIRVLTCSHI